MNYPHAQIGQLCLPTEQRDPRDTPYRPFKYVDISSVDKDLKAIVQTQEVIGKDAPSRARKVISTDDVLVSTVRPNLNAVAIVPSELDGQIASTGFCVLRPNLSVVNARYLFYRALTQDFIGYLTARMRGANYPAVTDEVVRKATIPLPPLSEQWRIVEILDQADALRKKRAEADAKAERILTAFFYEMFGDPATNPNGLRKQRLGTLISVRSGDFLPEKNMDKDGIFPVYGGNGINGYHSRYMFDDRTIIIGRVGVYCGVIHYSEPKCWVTDNALYVSRMSDNLRAQYLVMALKIANLNQYAGRAGQPLISGSRVYPVEILVPQVCEQERFSCLAEKMEQMKAAMQGVGPKIDMTFSTLLYRAFSGELTAAWREGHMKELLAEMEEQARYLGAHGPNGQRENAALQESLF